MIDYSVNFEFFICKTVNERMLLTFDVEFTNKIRENFS